jgi:hypothetical protein
VKKVNENGEEYYEFSSGEIVMFQEHGEKDTFTVYFEDSYYRKE